MYDHIHLWGLYILFLTGNDPDNIHWSKGLKLLFSPHPCLHRLFLHFFDTHHSQWRVTLFHYCLNLDLPNDNWCWALFHMPQAICLSSKMFLFIFSPHLLTGFLNLFLASLIFYISWIFSSYMRCWMWILFHIKLTIFEFYLISFAIKKLFNLIYSHWFIFLILLPLSMVSGDTFEVQILEHSSYVFLNVLLNVVLPCFTQYTMFYLMIRSLGLQSILNFLCNYEISIKF